MEQDTLDPWIQFFKTILDLPVPAALNSSTDDADEINRRNKAIYWKIKGITAKTTYRIFVKYSDPSKVENKPHIKSFANNF